MTDLVFLDTETTGLDPALHEVWEVAFAVNDGPIETRYLPHTLRTADPKALELNGYHLRAPKGKQLAEGFGFAADVYLREVLAGATIVGSNPAFDTAFLKARWGVAPWHHRLLAVESFAMPVLDYVRPQGLARVAEDLRELGYDIPTPDHTAAGDVQVLREAYRALCSEGGL